MWRAIFLGIAISICLIGLESMVIDRVVVPARGSAAGASAMDPSDPMALPGVTTSAKRTIKVAEWHPWSLLSVGAVLMLYSLTLRKGG